MNALAQSEVTALEQVPVQRGAMVVQQNSPAAIMLQALAQGSSIEDIGRMMDLQERYEAREAEKLCNIAFAGFKSEAVQIFKGKKVTAGPLAGKSYAELHDVVDAVTPALSRHGLSASWKITKDEKDWIEVTCTLKHVGGHSESVSMGGPPDSGGAKNAIQARASTVSYLQRYTLKAITGLSETDDDNDGGSEVLDVHLADWLSAINEATDLDQLKRTRRDGGASFTKKKDVPGYARFAAEASKRELQLKGANYV